jgi:subtilisin family serine protease
MSARTYRGASAGPGAGRRWSASPLLVDDDVPGEIVRDVVETRSSDAGELLGVLVELNLTAGAVPDQTLERFLVRHAEVLDAPSSARPTPRPVAAAYVRCLLTRTEIRNLLRVDDSRTPRTIFRIWPDYVMHAQMDRSISTIKADAAARTYGTTGAGIVWAVLDSGVDAEHPHFSCGTLTDPSVRDLHRDFTWLVRDDPSPPAVAPGTALIDEHGHGTHVAGIIAGAAPPDRPPHLAVLAPTTGDDGDLPRWTVRGLEPGRAVSGMAPLARLVSLKVLDSAGGAARTTSSAVIEALEYVRAVNAGGRLLRIHGVNLSIGCPWFFRDYAAGQSPLCRELDLLVGTGVVAVVSAGNGGYGSERGGGPHGVLSSITDPGNADRVITVGATHRDKPHTYGVSYLSSKGPTLDGRLKPDVLAPGERITSCASGRFRAAIPALPAGRDTACYAEDSGTSMAAPHVSGAIAALLSVRPEFVGRPDDIKELITTSAISLGRDRFFEGHGLVDLMGALARI